MYFTTRATQIFQGCVRLLGKAGLQALLVLMGPDKNGETLLATDVSAGEGKEETQKEKMAKRVVSFLKNNENVIEILSDSIDKFSTAMKPEEFSQFLKDMIKDGSIEIIEDGRARAIMFDTDFQGRIFHLFKLLAHNIKFQFLTFLSGPADDKASRNAAGTIKAQ